MQTLAFDIHIDNESKVKKYHQLYDCIVKAIQNGSLTQKLPSIRVLSEHTGLSKNTITKTYTELEQNGYIYSEKKKGYFVAHTVSIKSTSSQEIVSKEAISVPTVDGILRHISPVNEEESVTLPVPQNLSPLVNEIKHITHSVKKSVSTTDTLDITAAKSAKTEAVATPEALLQNAYKDILCTHTERLTQEKEPFGQFLFRKALADFLNRFFSIKTSADQIVIASGAEQLLSDIAKLKSLNSPFVKSDGMGLLQLAKKFTEGSIPTLQPVAAVAEITSHSLRKLFTQEGISVREIHCDEQGMNFDYLLTSGATLAFVTPNDIPETLAKDDPSFLERIQDMLHWAKQCSYRHIIEYDVAHITKTPGQTYKSLDADENVIYINSFENLFSGALNAAFAVLPKDICADFQQHYDHLSCSLSLLEQLALTDFLSKNFITV